VLVIDEIVDPSRENKVQIGVKAAVLVEDAIPGGIHALDVAVQRFPSFMSPG
jgi:hypothetical protein